MPIDFTAAVYEHAAYLIGRTPWEVSRDAELLSAAHAEAFCRYRHAPVVVGIDIYNLEAEAYGGVVDRPGGNGIPAIGTPILRSVHELADSQPFDPSTAGRIPMVIDVAARLARELPEADVRVPVSGPFSIASSLLGLETLLCDVAMEPEATTAALRHLAGGQVAFCEAIRHAGLDIAFFESAAAPPLMAPATFRRVELPALTYTIERAAEVVGHPVPCIIGGDTTPILEAILETGTGYVICPAETDQEAFVAKIRDRTDVRVRVNLEPEIMVRGTPEQLRAEIGRIQRITADRPNVCVGTGAMPYETPPENVLLIEQICAEQ